jgi:hypothetical protein
MGIEGRDTLQAMEREPQSGGQSLETLGGKPAFRLL